MQIAGMNVVGTGKQLVREIGDDDLTGLAAELAYRFFLALFPFAIFLAALGGVLARAAGVDNPAQEFVDTFGNTLPPDAASVVQGQVQGVVDGPNAGLLSVGIIGALWGASAGAGAVIKATTRAYDIPENRPFWKKTLLALGLTATGGLAIVAGFSAIVATQSFSGQLADAVGLGGAFELFLLIIRWPVVFLVVTLGVSLVYWAAPNTGLPFKWVTPGAALFGVGWLAVTTVFALYVANFGSYNATYGTLGGVVVLLLWFYLSSLVLLVGAELNAVIDEAKCGPALEERRRLVAEEIRTKRQKQPLNPESIATVGPTPSGAPPADADGAPQTHAGTASPVVAVAGLILAALAWRRMAR